MSRPADQLTFGFDGSAPGREPGLDVWREARRADRERRNASFLTQRNAKAAKVF
jgi:hypothetical protein